MKSRFAHALTLTFLLLGCQLDGPAPDVIDVPIETQGLPPQPPAPQGYVYAPDPMPPLPDDLYTHILCPDDGTHVNPFDLRRIAEVTMVNDQILLRETGVMVGPKAFNTAIAAQVFKPDRHVWYLNHTGFVLVDYVFGLDDSSVEMPEMWWFSLTFFNLNPSTTITLRRDAPGSPTQGIIKFVSAANDPWFATILLFNHGGRLRIGPYTTNGTAVFGGMSPF